ncbi:MAG: AAA family ATPase [Elusimicrobiota bacterium]
MRRIQLFFYNHWIKILIAFLVFLMVILALIGLLSMESYYLRLTLAQMPLQLLMSAVSAVIFAYVIINMQRGQFTGFKTPKIKGEDVSVGFKDVVGLDEAKKEAWEVVQLISDRRRVQKIGGQILRGLLMVGPPGCGKTLMAKAIAKESGIPFISVSGSEFVEIFVGMGASRVRKLFKKARQLAYAYGACIVFIDELDVIGRGRSWSFMGGGEETNSTQNQLLVEMDGLRSKDFNVIVIGATNAAESVLDKALLRPGRFDRKIFIDRPGLEGREQLFRYYFGKVKHDAAIDLSRLARKTVYKTPADIENIVKESALIATRDKRDVVEFKDLCEALDRIDMGIKHKRRMTVGERKMIAYHESGHLVALYILHPTDDVFKVSIVSRGETLGAVAHQPREELFTSNSEQVLANIKVCLGGYLAEKIKFGVTSTGVASDFQKAMHQAHQMVWEYGMADSGFFADYTVIPKDQLSDVIKEKLNEETRRILKQCYEAVENLLRAEWHILERFVQELLVKDELDFDEIEAIFAEYGKTNQFKLKEEADLKLLESQKNSTVVQPNAVAAMDNQPEKKTEF